MFWSPIICFDSTIIGDQNIRLLCHFKADLWAINCTAVTSPKKWTKRTQDHLPTPYAANTTQLARIPRAKQLSTAKWTLCFWAGIFLWKHWGSSRSHSLAWQIITTTDDALGLSWYLQVEWSTSTSNVGLTKPFGPLHCLIVHVFIELNKCILWAFF